jgi:hypothetical protein
MLLGGGRVDSGRDLLHSAKQHSPAKIHAVSRGGRKEGQGLRKLKSFGRLGVKMFSRLVRSCCSLLD